MADFIDLFSRMMIEKAVGKVNSPSLFKLRCSLADRQWEVIPIKSKKKELLNTFSILLAGG